MAASIVATALFCNNTGGSLLNHSRVQGKAGIADHGEGGDQVILKNEVRVTEHARGFHGIKGGASGNTINIQNSMVDLII